VPDEDPAEVEAVVLACRDQQRIGRDRIAQATGVPSRSGEALSPEEWTDFYRRHDQYMV
jgi:hypothetical protein